MTKGGIFNSAKISPVDFHLRLGFYNYWRAGAGASKPLHDGEHHHLVLFVFSAQIKLHNLRLGGGAMSRARA
jgi:hypothetical protein